jgi:cellulose synthase/poly-beta-1,6-N-acetylglucosamine synthase-like glycosyltransferase
VAGGRLAGCDPDRVIVAVVDADGRLEQTALREVTPYFADREVAGVQVGVRINNRRTNWLARMQDMEFVIFTEVFQRGRRHLNSVGLGGNGQFMRLSALLDLGPAPWSRCLTEDLDLGVRLLARGWRNDFCSTAAVHQQGLVELGRLMRQRTRWFQGHLQSWRLVSTILRGAPRRARADLLYHLSSPLLLLIASLMTSSFVVSLGAYAVLLAGGQNPAGWWLLSTYLLAFGPAVAYSVVYWTRERDTGLSLPGAVLLGHLYVGYGLIWYAAGWRAVARTLRGESGWAKTERTVEPPAVQLAGSAP